MARARSAGILRGEAEGSKQVPGSTAPQRRLSGPRLAADLPAASLAHDSRAATLRCTAVPAASESVAGGSASDLKAPRGPRSSGGAGKDVKDTRRCLAGAVPGAGARFGGMSSSSSGDASQRCNSPTPGAKLRVAGSGP